MGEQSHAAYWGELKDHARPIAAATLGVAFAMAINTYTSGLFGAHLIKEFGWAKAQLALTGAFGIVNMLLVPFWGRFTDRFGPRAEAIIGFVAVPLSYLAYSMMGSDIRGYCAISVFHQLFGVLTTTIVFARVIIERFEATNSFNIFLIVCAVATLLGTLAFTLTGRAANLTSDEEEVPES